MWSNRTVKKMALQCKKVFIRVINAICKCQICFVCKKNLCTVCTCVCREYWISPGYMYVLQSPLSLVFLIPFYVIKIYYVRETGPRSILNVHKNEGILGIWKNRWSVRIKPLSLSIYTVCTYIHTLLTDCLSKWVRRLAWF